MESLGWQALLQGNSHIPRPFVNVGKNYMNHSAKGYNEFDSWESELTKKHKSGIKDRVSEFVQVKHAYAHMGLPFEHSRQGKVGFHDLDYPLLVEGELGIILEPSLQVSDGKLVGRLLLLQKISQLQRVYQWPVVRDFYAAVLQRIERGMITWDRLDLASLELTIMSRAQLQGSNSTTYQWPTGRKWGYRPSASSVHEKVNDFGAEPMPPKGGNNKNKQETFFCSPFQRNLCWYEGPHSGKYNGRMVTRLHICAACWLKDKVRANHPESSKDCPHNQKWLGEQKVQCTRVGLLMANEVIKGSKQPNYLGVRMKINSKINVSFLEAVVHREDDQLTLEFLTYRCPIGLDRGVTSVSKPFPTTGGHGNSRMI